jgi:hypothetical protein
VWDAVRRELRWQEKVVKHFRRCAPNQELLLESFQEQGWPERIDDPLPRDGNTIAEDRLRETVKSLNRGITRGGLRFRVEVGGRGVRWGWLEAAAVLAPHGALP